MQQKDWKQQRTIDLLWMFGEVLGQINPITTPKGPFKENAERCLEKFTGFRMWYHLANIIFVLALFAIPGLVHRHFVEKSIFRGRDYDRFAIPISSTGVVVFAAAQIHRVRNRHLIKAAKKWEPIGDALLRIINRRVDLSTTAVTNGVWAEVPNMPLGAKSELIGTLLRAFADASAKEMIEWKFNDTPKDEDLFQEEKDLALVAEAFGVDIEWQRRIVCAQERRIYGG